MSGNIQRAAAAPNNQDVKELPLPFLILTSDLIIRPILTQDKAVAQDAITESLKDLKMWLPWVESKPKLEDAGNICDKFFHQAETKEVYHFSVYNNDQFLGMCSFLGTDYENMTTNLGYWCRTENESEEKFIDAINAVLRYGFEVAGIKEFNISCVVGNYTSEVAAKNLNFKLQGIDLVKNKQIKNFKISNLYNLPELNVQWIKESGSGFSENKAPESIAERVEPAKVETPTFLDSDF